VYCDGRYYYRFAAGSLRCTATFVGDMGLVKMALAAEDICRLFQPTTLVVLGLAAGFPRSGCGRESL
jgi:nucleoside phosphorylase